MPRRLKAAREIAALPRRRGRAVARSDARQRPMSCWRASIRKPKIFSERLHSPEAKAAFEAFFARKR